MSKINIYEAYIYVNAQATNLQLDRTLTVDKDAGEYISIRHLTSGTTIRPEDKNLIPLLLQGWHFITVASKTLSTHPSAIKLITELRVLDSNNTLYRLFDITQSKLISKLGPYNSPLKYVEKVRLFSETLRYGSEEFSSVISNGELKFIIPSSGNNIVPVDRERNGGIPRCAIKIMFFNSNLFTKNVHTRLNFKIDLLDKKDSNLTLHTPNISDIKFTVTYL